MRYALAPALIAICAAQPALARPCSYPMARLASAQPQAIRPAPRAKDMPKPPCAILQKWTPDARKRMLAPA